MLAQTARTMPTPEPPAPAGVQQRLPARAQQTACPAFRDRLSSVLAQAVAQRTPAPLARPRACLLQRALDWSDERLSGEYLKALGTPLPQVSGGLTDHDALVGDLRRALQAYAAAATHTLDDRLAALQEVLASTRRYSRRYESTVAFTGTSQDQRERFHTFYDAVLMLRTSCLAEIVRVVTAYIVAGSDETARRQTMEERLGDDADIVERAWRGVQPALGPEPAVAYAPIDGPLYGTSGGPEVADVTQGAVGDCWLLSTLSSAARSPQGRAMIQQMIVSVTDRTWEVTFWQPREARRAVEDVDRSASERADPITVSNLFPVELDGTFAYALKQRPAGTPLWPAVIEKAFAIVKGGYDKINVGLGADVAMAAVGGRASEGGTLPPAESARVDVQETIQHAVAAGDPVVLGTPKHWVPVVAADDTGLTFRDQARITRGGLTLEKTATWEQLFGGVPVEAGTGAPYAFNAWSVLTPAPAASSVDQDALEFSVSDIDLLAGFLAMPTFGAPPPPPEAIDFDPPPMRFRRPDPEPQPEPRARPNIGPPPQPRRRRGRIRPRRQPVSRQGRLPSQRRPRATGGGRQRWR